MSDVQTHTDHTFGILGWSLARDGVWLPGIYDSDETAREAVSLPDDVLQALSDRICSVQGEFRLITAKDLMRATEQP